MIRYYTGNTIVMPIEIVSDTITDLTGSKIVFSAINRNTGIEIIKEPVIDGMIVTATLEAEDTLIPGVYTCEFRGLFSGVIKTLDYDTILLKQANIKEVITDGN